MSDAMVAPFRVSISDFSHCAAISPRSTCAEEASKDSLSETVYSIKDTVTIPEKQVLTVMGIEQHFSGEFVKPERNAFGNKFRAYAEESERKLGVENFYRINHINQTYDFVQKMKEKHLKLDKRVMSIWDAALLLNETVDESDPDLDMPQIEHLLQTSEAIRRDHPNEDWLHLVGFIHDLGKVLLHPSFGSEPQWAVVGDTFPVGCKFSDSIVHSNYFKENPDSHNEKYSTLFGVYKESCGLDNVHMSWSHDEYMYQVMLQNGCTIPTPGLFIIRFHSFYSLHNNGEYQHLLNDHDKEMFPWLLEFNKYDLYSKSKVPCDVKKLKPYYISLIDKYFPKELRW